MRGGGSRVLRDGFETVIIVFVCRYLHAPIRSSASRPKRTVSRPLDQRTTQTLDVRGRYDARLEQSIALKKKKTTTSVPTTRVRRVCNLNRRNNDCDGLTADAGSAVEHCDYWYLRARGRFQRDVKPPRTRDPRGTLTS